MIKNLTVLLLIGIVIFLFFYSKEKERIIAGSTMGTYYKIIFIGNQKDSFLKNEVEKNLIDINDKMSTFSTSSQISKFNLFKSSEWYEISHDLHEVIKESLRISEFSKGAFDITVKKLVDLWGFGVNKDFIWPAKRSIRNLKAKVGYSKLLLKENFIKKLLPSIEIDLSAIAKGYTVDKISKLLDEKLINNYLIDIGGELKAKGKRFNKSWVIGIEKPLPMAREVEKKIFLCDMAIATSGDYRNYFEKDGKRYSHLIDPRTGKPISHNTVSVSVLHKSCMTADALATALIVLGEKEAFDLALKHNVAAFFQVKEKDGFKELVTPLFINMSKCGNFSD